MAFDSLMVSREVAPVRARVVENLRGAIISQRFQPGERLREKDLCELTGTSRTSVREALRQLESEGLVEVMPNIGPVVATVSPQAARDLYEVRASLEGLAGRLSAERATQEQIDRLAATVEQYAQTSETQRDVLLALKDDFYTSLLDAAGNVEITRMLQGLRARVTVLRTTTLSRPGRAAETVIELRAIIRAISSHDPVSAEAACCAHVQAALNTALQALSEEKGVVTTKTI